jgi:hypothetical protein
VTGLALLADGLIRPWGAAAPLLAAEDYRGLVFAAYPSRVAGSALRALGARASGVWGAPLIDAFKARRLDAMGRPLWQYATNAPNADVAPYGVSNVVLWPSVLTLIADPDYLDGLPAEQRRWVERAAADAAAASVGLGRRELRLVDTACTVGGRFSRATPAAVNQLRAAFAPALAALEQDAGTRASIARIRALITDAPDDAALAIPSGCTGAPLGRLGVGQGRPSPYDGVYRWTLTPEDQSHDPFYDATAPHVTSVFTLWLDRQHWRMHATDSGRGPDQVYTGTFRVDGDRATFAWGQDGTALNVFRFKRTRDGLRVTGISGERGDLFVWAYKPWRQVG